MANFDQKSQKTWVLTWVQGLGCVTITQNFNLLCCYQRSPWTLNWTVIRNRDSLETSEPGGWHVWKPIQH